MKFGIVGMLRRRRWNASRSLGSCVGLLRKKSQTRCYASLSHARLSPNMENYLRFRSRHRVHCQVHVNELRISLQRCRRRSIGIHLELAGFNLDIYAYRVDSNQKTWSGRTTHKRQSRTQVSEVVQPTQTTSYFFFACPMDRYLKRRKQNPQTSHGDPQITLSDG